MGNYPRIIALQFERTTEQLVRGGLRGLNIKGLFNYYSLYLHNKFIDYHLFG
ncbi:hypothetical protein HDF22_003527 [Mucilaginibacter lappiensis]|uniref:Uncharacterized protein n=1 Tax=Mucilaginibacter lappiensis TaxID=354630 RepID=A0A841JNB1_9SPHI|nr:hypothetical protein [Mucilaginibacter lappiensis]